MKLGRTPTILKRISARLSALFQLEEHQTTVRTELLAGPKLVDSLFAVIMLIISFSLVNMFDSIGTLVGAARQNGMVDKDGEIPV